MGRPLTDKCSSQNRRRNLYLCLNLVQAKHKVHPALVNRGNGGKKDSDTAVVESYYVGEVGHDSDSRASIGPVEETYYVGA